MVDHLATFGRPLGDRWATIASRHHPTAQLIKLFTIRSAFAGIVPKHNYWPDTYFPRIPGIRMCSQDTSGAWGSLSRLLYGGDSFVGGISFETTGSGDSKRTHLGCRRTCSHDGSTPICVRGFSVARLRACGDGCLQAVYLQSEVQDVPPQNQKQRVAKVCTRPDEPPHP